MYEVGNTGQLVANRSDTGQFTSNDELVLVARKNLGTENIVIIETAEHNSRFHRIDLAVIDLDEGLNTIQLVKSDSKDPFNSCYHCVPYIFKNEDLGGEENSAGTKIFNDAPDGLLQIFVNSKSPNFQVTPHPLQREQLKNPITVKRIAFEEKNAVDIHFRTFNNIEADECLPEIFNASYFDNEGTKRGATFAILVIDNMFIYMHIDSNIPELSVFKSFKSEHTFTSKEEELQFRRVIKDQISSKLQQTAAKIGK
jgi:hypothetical protein